MNKASLVTVIVPAYNAKRYLREAVASLQAQTYGNLQIIIVNDGSTDGTGNIADECASSDKRVIVIHKVNGGVSAARNEALRIAKGEYICFLDSDDVYLPEKVEKQVKFLTENTRCDYVYSDFYKANAELKDLIPSTAPNFDATTRQYLMCSNWIPPLTPMLRSSLIKKVGLFDPMIAGGEDWDYWLTCEKYTELAHIPECLAIYRLHPQQSHRKRAMMRSDEERVIKKHFAQNPREYRVAIGARNMFYARLHKCYGQYWSMWYELMLLIFNTRSISDILFIIKVVR